MSVDLDDADGVYTHLGMADRARASSAQFLTRTIRRHSAYVLVLDRRRRPRIYYPPSVPAPVLARDLRGMLAANA